MQWTADAIEDLKRLALEGRSASVIAAALGAASRSAVIGKADRIGIKLNGCGRASALHGKPAGTHRVRFAAIPHSKSVPKKRNPVPAFNHEPQRKPGSTLAEAEVGEMRRLKFEEIRQLACPWPLGDPKSGDFAYCGLMAAKGQSYWVGHRRMAYRAP
jgi:GcrA cell cycle regulator